MMMGASTATTAVPSPALLTIQARISFSSSRRVTSQRRSSRFTHRKRASPLGLPYQPKSTPMKAGQSLQFTKDEGVSGLTTDELDLVPDAHCPFLLDKGV